MESHSNLLRALPRILRSSLDVFKGTRNLFFSTPTRKTFTFEQQQQLSSSLLRTVADDASLASLISTTSNVVVHFGASWCDPCKAMNDIMETLASEFAASSSSSDSQNQRTVFAYCDAEILEDSAETYEVTSVPTFLVFREAKVVKTIEGADGGQLAQAVSTYCSSSVKGSEGSKTTSGTTVMKATSNKEKENVKPDGGGKETEEELQKRLIHLTTVQPVVLFMKGNRESPQCGFSRKSSEALTNAGITYGTFDILSDENVRQGLKVFSDWPTYPQLYLNGELAGGNDIILEMAADGTLKTECEQAIEKWTKAKTERTNKRIESILAQSKDILLFMKGSPNEPKCGFSSKVVNALNKSGEEYDTFDILKDDEIRQGMKVYSDWPTFPQLYYKKELLGGCDIVLEMGADGSLKDEITK